jgi:hypothetical protein
VALTVWVDGAAILAHVGNATPTQTDASWADACASAVTDGINRRLRAAADPLPDGALAELTAAALVGGTEAYKRRKAPFGITGYVDLQGSAIRVSRDWLDSIDPMIRRYASLVGSFA